MPRTKVGVNRDVVELLTELLGAALDGDVTDVFVVFRRSDREYGRAWAADNMDDMILEAGDAVMSTRLARFKAQQAPIKH